MARPKKNKEIIIQQTTNDQVVQPVTDKNLSLMDRVQVLEDKLQDCEAYNNKLSEYALDLNRKIRAMKRDYRKESSIVSALDNRTNATDDLSCWMNDIEVLKRNFSNLSAAYTDRSANEYILSKRCDALQDDVDVLKQESLDFKVLSSSVDYINDVMIVNLQAKIKAIEDLSICDNVRLLIEGHKDLKSAMKELVIYKDVTYQIGERINLVSNAQDVLKQEIFAISSSLTELSSRVWDIEESPEEIKPLTQNDNPLLEIIKLLLERGK